MSLSDKELTATLKEMPLFAGMSKKDISATVSTAAQRRFPAGAQIVQDGRGGVGFYLILSGRAEVRKDDQAVAELTSGQFFGETALLVDDAKRTADVVAADETTCLVMTSWDFKAFIETNPDAAAYIARQLAERAAD